MSDAPALIEMADHWVIPLGGKTVTQIRIDYAFSLIIWESRDLDFAVRIEGRFIFQVGNEEYALDAEEGAHTLCPALAIFGKTIQSALAHKDGTLELTFSDDSRVLVPPDPQYEAWEVSGPGGMLLVSLPGGSLAVWSSQLADR